MNYDTRLDHYSSDIHLKQISWDFQIKLTTINISFNLIDLIQNNNFKIRLICS